MKATTYILKTIKSEGVDHVFLVPGGVMDPFLREFGEGTGVQGIVAAHEAGAAYMADGYARASQRFGVCMGIGGPGVANMVGPLAAAYADQSPVLAIVGEVPTDWEGRGGFQDASPAGLNDIGFLKTITEFAVETPIIELIPHHLNTAMHSMLGVELRPVVVSLPQQIQTQELDPNRLRSIQYLKETPRLLDRQAAMGLASALQKAEKFVILAGNGAARSDATDEMVAFAEKYCIPVATTLRAKGVFPEDHPLSLGVFGYAGTPHATQALLRHENDLLLVLGSSLNQRDTMVWNRALRPTHGIFQVDINPDVFDRSYPVDASITSDVRELLEWLLNHEGMDFDEALKASQPARESWVASIRKLPRFYDEETQTSDAVPMHPARVVTELRRATPRESVILVDSGAHRAFTGHHWTSYAPQQYLTSTMLAPMGWAIPAAVGAKTARPELPCVVVTGDGCMLMHGIELQTAAHHNLPIVIVVINNSALGNVYLRAKQVSESAGNLTRLSTHNWAQFAQALGGDGVVVESPDQLPQAFDRAFQATGPFVVDARCDPNFKTPITPWEQAKQEWVDDH